jgi:hypothetical protein
VETGPELIAFLPEIAQRLLFNAETPLQEKAA